MIHALPGIAAGYRQAGSSQLASERGVALNETHATESSGPVSDRPTQTSAADRAAFIIAEVFSPAHLVIAITAVSGLPADGLLWQRIGWGLLAALFTGILPYLVALHAIRRGSLSSRDIPIRSERIAPMLWTGLSVLLGWAILVLAGAPDSVLAVQVAMVSGLVTALAITLVWKISIHCGVAAAVVVVATLLFGSWASLAWLIVAAIGWSRIHTWAHTKVQVVAGIVVGAFSAWPALLFV